MRLFVQTTQALFIHFKKNTKFFDKVNNLTQNTGEKFSITNDFIVENTPHSNFLYACLAVKTTYRSQELLLSDTRAKEPWHFYFYEWVKVLIFNLNKSAGAPIRGPQDACLCSSRCDRMVRVSQCPSGTLSHSTCVTERVQTQICEIIFFHDIPIPIFLFFFLTFYYKSVLFPFYLCFIFAHKFGFF